MKKWLLDGLSRVAIEQEVTVTTVTERKVDPQVGDEVRLIVRGKVAAVIGDEIEVTGLSVESVAGVVRRRGS